MKFTYFIYIYIYIYKPIKHTLKTPQCHLYPKGPRGASHVDRYGCNEVRALQFIKFHIALSVRKGCFSLLCAWRNKTTMDINPKADIIEMRIGWPLHSVMKNHLLINYLWLDNDNLFFLPLLDHLVPSRSSAVYYHNCWIVLIKILYFIKCSFKIIVTLMAIWVSLLNNWNLNIMLINSNNCQFYFLYDKLYFWK